jgi:hypothetical protein
MVGMLKKIKDNINSIVAYADTAYFIEIIYIMIALDFLSGKMVSVFAGVIFTILLSFHIIMIYLRRETNRKIQLFIMDLHLAYSIPYFLNIAVYGYRGREYDYIFLIVRLLLVFFEGMAIYVLTDDEVIEGFAAETRGHSEIEFLR